MGRRTGTLLGHLSGRTAGCAGTGMITDLGEAGRTDPAWSAQTVRKLMDAAALRPQTDLMDDTEKLETIAKVTARLAARYPDAPRPLIAQVVTEEYETLDAGRIRTYIPTLVERGAKNRLSREFSAQTAKI